MKEIKVIKYEAEDGTIFDTEDECREHDVLYSNSGYEFYDCNGQVSNMSEDINSAIYVLLYGEHGYDKLNYANQNDDNFPGQTFDVNHNPIKSGVLLYREDDDEPANYGHYEILAYDKDLYVLRSVIDNAIKKYEEAR